MGVDRLTLIEPTKHAPLDGHILVNLSEVPTWTCKTRMALQVQVGTIQKKHHFTTLQAKISSEKKNKNINIQRWFTPCLLEKTNPPFLVI
jgi:hypothetical protein